MNSSLRYCLTRLALVAISMTLFATYAFSTKYYVNASSGKDSSYDGKSESTAWKTFKNITSSNIFSGDTIVLFRGCTWYEQLPVPASNLTFDYYGTTGVRPIVDAGDSLRGLAWSRGQDSIWTAPLDTTQFPGRVWLQGIELGIAGDRGHAASGPNSQYRWNYNGTNIQIYSSSNPGTIGVANVLLPNGDFRHAVYFENQSNITFRNIDFRRGDVCIEIHNGQNIYFENCAVGLGTSRMGIFLADGSDNGHIFGCQLDRLDTFYHLFQYAGNYNGGNSCDCVTMQWASGWDIHNNVIADPGHSGVCLSAPAGKYVQNNKIHDNEFFMRSGDYGRAFDVQAAQPGHATGNLFYNNYIHNMTVFSQIGGSNNAFYYNVWDTTRVSSQDSIDRTKQRAGCVLFWADTLSYGSTNNRVCNNVFMNSQGPAVTVNCSTGGSIQGNNLIANNLFYNNGLLYDQKVHFHFIQLWTYGGSNNADTIENNLFYQSNDTLNQIDYLYQVMTVDTLNVKSGGDFITHNIAKNPLLDSNYTLPYYSPAVDSGANVGLSLDKAGTPVPFGNKPDIGAFESLALRAEISGNDVVLTWAAPPAGNDLGAYSLALPNGSNSFPPSTATSSNDAGATSHLGQNTQYKLTANSNTRGALGTTFVKVIKPSSPVSTSATWSGTVYLPNTVTINSGVTVTLLQGTRVRGLSPTGGLLNVSGTLLSLGSLNFPVSFDRSTTSGVWGGITLNSGSSASVLSYCKVLHADKGIYENGVSVNVSNSAIDSCTEGIYLYNSSAKIHKCNIHHNTDAGVYVISCSNPPYPILDSNYIQNNNYGIFCTTNSNPKLGNGSAHGINKIINNYNGVICFNNSYPVLGMSSPLDGGYNDLINTQFNVYNMDANGGIYAQNNWWGTTNQMNFKIAGTSSVSPTPYLTDSVIVPAPPLSKSAGIIVASGAGSLPMQSTLDSVYQLLSASNPGAARAACLNLINNYPDYSVSYNALNLLRETFSASDVAGPKNLYLSLFNTKAKKPLYAVAGLILASIDKPNTLSWLDQVLQSYGTDSVAELALFDKFVWYYFEQQDRSNAVRISGQLDSLFHLSISAVEAHMILGDSLGANAGQTLQKPDAKTPIAYMLYQNYPNPFNPSTNIRYALTEDANVSLVVYDILGREVTTLVNNAEVAGYHTIVWNATRAASGVYFLRIRVTSGYGVTKYTKVTKLMVLK